MFFIFLLFYIQFEILTHQNTSVFLQHKKKKTVSIINSTKYYKKKQTIKTQNKQQKVT